MPTKQCQLTDGAMQMVAWIPSPVAETGRTVIDSSGKRWRVETVYDWSERDSTPYAVKDIRDHRRATGDAERKAKSP